MDEQSWSKPVTFDWGTARFRTITDTEEASHFLVNYWLVQGGDKHLEARKVCLAVLAGEKPADDARTAFVKAAQEAEIFVKS